MSQFRKKGYLLLCLLFPAMFSLPVRADLILSAPPRQMEAQADAVYNPIAQLLSKATGQKVTYKFVDNWLSYESDVLKDKYDIVFDGPAFIGWRMAKYGWSPIVKLPAELSIVVAVSNTNTSIKNLTDLEGYPICGFSPPNLATLVVQYQFTNPSRQPNIIAVKTFPDAYQGVLSGKCVAAILNAKIYKILNGKTQAMRVVFRSKPMANQAFSASPRVTPQMRNQIANALLSPEGLAATQKLRAQFKAKQFVPATDQEYSGLGRYMRDVWGFDLPSSSQQPAAQ